MPNTPSANMTESSIRRRSGAINLGNGTGPGHALRSSSSNLKRKCLEQQIETADMIQIDGHPTIMLVRTGGIQTGHPSFPSLPSCDAIGMRSTATQGLLTDSPENKAHRRLASGFQASRPTAAPCTVIQNLTCPTPVKQSASRPQSSRLPPPKYSCGPEAVGTRCAARQPHMRTDSSSSVSSVSSTYSNTSTSSSQSSSVKLLRCPPAFGKLTTDNKLFRKFPVSRTVRKLAIISPVDAAGLGIEQIDRWTAHKWWLFLSVCTVFCYGTAGLVYAVLTWFKTWEQAEVMHVADYDILVLITLASSIVLLTFIIGITGTILNSRPILAVYALLLWPALISVLAIGYTAYKRYAFALDRKLNLAWSQWYTPVGRLDVQDVLRCCGYYSPLHEATASPRCYARSPLPGCKGKLYRFEKDNLHKIWTAAFSAVGLHVVNIFVSLLCANHVTQTFGKGIMPRRYRLSGADVRADAEKILGTLRELGAVARPALTRLPASAMFWEDKAHVQAALKALPASLRPGRPIALSSDSLTTRKCE